MPDGDRIRHLFRSLGRQPHQIERRFVIELGAPHGPQQRNGEYPGISLYAEKSNDA
jgi:hypothetical protein